MDNNRKPFSFRSRLKSFVYAGRGIISFFRSEHNAIIHLAATVAVVFFGIWLSVSKNEWLLIVLAIGIVFSAEIFNTAIEKLADEVKPEYSEAIKKVKDLSAAAVLVVAVAAAIMGLVIFLPLLWQKFFL